MIALARALRYLLQEHEYVSLPGLGSLVRQTTHATVDEHLRLIDPPKITYGFMADRRFDDGALAGYIRSFVPVDEGPLSTPEDLAAEWIRNVSAELAAGRSVALAGIGTLISDGDRIAFTPADQAMTASPYAYCESLLLPPPRSNRGRQARWGRRRVVWAVSVSLLVGVTVGAAYLSTQDNLLERLNIDIPALDQMALHDPPAVAAAIDSAHGDLSPTDTLVTGQDTGQVAASSPDATRAVAPNTPGPQATGSQPKPRKSPTASNIKLRQNEALRVPSPVPAPTHRYYVVCGTFERLENAQKLRRTLTEAGYTVEINQWDGKHYVSIGRYDTKSEAVAQRNENLKRLPDYELWVLTREL